MLRIKEKFLDQFILCPFTGQTIYLRFLEENMYKHYFKKLPKLFEINDIFSSQQRGNTWREDSDSIS